MRKQEAFMSVLFLMAVSTQAFAGSQMTDQEVANTIGAALGGIIGLAIGIFIVRKLFSR